MLLFLFAVMVVCPCGRASALTVSGLPSWILPAAERSLTAVWSEIPSDSATDREGTLELVASRLFSGYKISVAPAGDTPSVTFTAENLPPLPEVRIIMPDLRGYAEIWFSADVAGLPEKVSAIAGEIPQAALPWADDMLRGETASLVSGVLPGWNFSQQIYISPGRTQINLSFRPSDDMILAVRPSVVSRTVPVMFRADLEAKILPCVSPLIGLPVKWARRHQKDIEAEAQKFLEDRNTVSNMKASVKVSFAPGRISDMSARVDSRDFMFRIWVSAYAGIEGKNPEAGAFFGFRPVWNVGDVNLAPEIYGELLLSLDNFGMAFRTGMRIETLENLWAGLEYNISAGRAFLRMEYIPVKIRRPYAIWRWEIGRVCHELSLGYKFDEHISAELYYDGSFGLRGMWSL